MRLSTILNEMMITDYEVHNEKDFINMSFLLPGRTEKNRCVFINDKKYLRKIDDTVKMVFLSTELSRCIDNKNVGFCVVDDPRLMFYSVHNYLSQKENYKRKSFETKIGKDCEISSTAVVPDENIIIGNNVTIEDRVILIGHIKIGDGSIIRSGSVIGSDGNDFKRYGDRLIRTKQIGGVLIGNNVEVDPNCCIERPMFPYEDTVIDNESKIGAISFVAHGTKIGKRTQIKGMVNIAGYSNIGDDVFIGPGATISNLVSIGNDAHVTIGSVVVSNVPKGEQVSGNFAIKHREFLANQLSLLRNRREEEKAHNK